MNVAWAIFNLAAAYVLLVLVANVALRQVAEAGVAATGFGLASHGIARSATRLRIGSPWLQPLRWISGPRSARGRRRHPPA